MHFPGGNATDPIWRLLASSDGISSWTPLKPQHSNLNPNSYPLANQLWCIDFLTPPTPLIIPHRLTALIESLMPLKNWCSIHARRSKIVWNIPHVSVAFFPSLKQKFIAYRSSKVSSRPDCIFEIHQLWQSDFSRVYSNSWCSCSFELEIIKIGQSSHKMYSINILNFQESTTILNACIKQVWKLIEGPTYLHTRTNVKHVWCNDYRRREFTRQVKYESWIQLFAFHFTLIPFGKKYEFICEFKLFIQRLKKKKNIQDLLTRFKGSNFSNFT